MSERPLLKRRRLMQSAGAVSALLFSGKPFALAAEDAASDAPGNSITAQLARYMAQARTMPLPAPVAIACKHRILDTFGAMVSASRMRPGMLAAQYVREMGGTPQSSVIGTRIRTNIVNAALANAMCAHSDEPTTSNRLPRRTPAVRSGRRPSPWPNVAREAEKR